MKARTLTFPAIWLIAATRGMAGAGIGLLLADRLTPRRRRALGWTLFGVGAASTIPLIRYVLGQRVVEEDEPVEAEV